jgi:adenylate cyclase
MYDSSPPNAWLETSDGTRITLHGNCSLGRSSENVVVIPSDRASRRHAIIHAQEGEFWLIDLGSINGTSVNQRRVQQPIRLNAGDSITIAGHDFRFNQTTAGDEDDVSFAGASTVTIPDIRNEYCWLLISDIVDFTSLSQRLPPEDLAVVMGQWVKANRQLIAANGGDINKYLGDGYMAFWRDGFQVPQQIAAALKGLCDLQRNCSPVFRHVLHYGRISIGGAAAVGEEALMGPEVNFAFRLEKLAGELGIPAALSAAAKERLSGLILTRPLNKEHPLRGFPGTYRIFAMED